MSVTYKHHNFFLNLHNSSPTVRRSALEQEIRGSRGRKSNPATTENTFTCEHLP